MRKKTTKVSVGENNQIEGYFLLFGSPDEKDLQGEYFTPETELNLEEFNRGLYYHTLDFKDPFLTIGDIISMFTDEIGVYATAMLRPYDSAKVTKQLIQHGDLHFAPMTKPDLLVINEDGKIVEFPLEGITITPYPVHIEETDDE